MEENSPIPMFHPHCTSWLSLPYSHHWRARILGHACLICHYKLFIMFYIKISAIEKNLTNYIDHRYAADYLQPTL